MASNLNIIRGDNSDYHDLVHIWKESVTATHNFVSKADLLALEGEIAKLYLPAISELWMAIIDGNKGGFLGCNDSNLEMLFLKPQYFGQGAGSALLAHASRLHGPLKVSVNVQNTGALNFYGRNGFTVCGYSSHDDQGREYPLFHMEQEGCLKAWQK